MSVLIAVIFSFGFTLYCMKACHERFNAVEERVDKLEEKNNEERKDF